MRAAITAPSLALLALGCANAHPAAPVIVVDANREPVGHCRSWHEGLPESFLYVDVEEPRRCLLVLLPARETGAEIRWTWDGPAGAEPFEASAAYVANGTCAEWMQEMRRDEGVLALWREGNPAAGGLEVALSGQLTGHDGDRLSGRLRLRSELEAFEIELEQSPVVREPRECIRECEDILDEETCVRAGCMPIELWVAYVSLPDGSDCRLPHEEGRLEYASCFGGLGWPDTSEQARRPSDGRCLTFHGLGIAPRYWERCRGDDVPRCE